MTAQPKLCKDCEHFVRNTEEWGDGFNAIKYAVCRLSSHVSGFDWVYCSDRRKWSLFGECGPSGKQWEEAK